MVAGRSIPTEKQPSPKIYRLRLFAPDHVRAKSRFWYFMKKLKKIKKSSGELLACQIVSLVILIKSDSSNWSTIV